MDLFYIDLAFSVVISLLRRLITDPESKEKMRKVFYKVHSLIEIAYPEIVIDKATALKVSD